MLSILVFLFLFILNSCAGFVAPGYKRAVDLSWDFDEKTTYWPGIRNFSFSKQVTHLEDGLWYAMNEFCAGEHGGTHLDAPYHFNQNGWKVGEIPLEKLITNGAFISTNKSELEVEDLQEWIEKNGPFQNNTGLLVKFGFSQFWTEPRLYFKLDEMGKEAHFPGISHQAANFIANSSAIVGVGVDTASVDSGNSRDFLTHRILSSNMIYGMENVKILEDLPPKGFTLFALPMKIKQGTGAPLRLVAMIP